MAKQIDLGAFEAAKRLASFSPETRFAFEQSSALWSGEPEEVSQAFRAIGSAVASKRHPVGDVNKKKLFAFAEQLLKQSSDEVSNAVATCMLDQIWQQTRTSGFDFSTIDAFLGPEARRFLISWDDFCGRRTPGLSRD